MAKKLSVKKNLGRSTWSGFISLGMLSIPVKIYRAVSSRESEKVKLNMVCPEGHGRLKQQYVCEKHSIDPITGEVMVVPIEREAIAKGFESEPDKFIVIESGFLEKIAPESDKLIKVGKFLDSDLFTITMIDIPFYVVPEAAGEDAYLLLRDAMESTGTCAVGRVVMSQREQVVMLTAQEGGIIMYSLNPPGLIREATPYFEGLGRKADVKMLAVMTKLIGQKTTKGFDDEDFRDQREELLLESIQARIAGRELMAPTPTERVAPSDLMAALLGSVK